VQGIFSNHLGALFLEEGTVAKIRISRTFIGDESSEKRRFKFCLPASFELETGEILARGCGKYGLYETDVGLHCFYCGNYLYLQEPSLNAMWFHFRLGREYWRAMYSRDNIFINGVPVTGLVDCLPRCLVSDLVEPNPPPWFPYFIVYDGPQFKRYLEKYKHA
jgi:hypothetical protein